MTVRLLRAVPAARALSHPRAIQPCTVSGRTWRARASVYFVKLALLILALAPSRWSMCQTELCERRKILAISLTGWSSISFSRCCCSGAVHPRWGRFDSMPLRRTNLQQAHLGFPDSSARPVTRALNSEPLAFMFARTRSLAAFDQQNSRREFPSCTSSMLLATPGSCPVDLEESLTEYGSDGVSAFSCRELSGSWSSTFIIGPSYFYTNEDVRCVALSEYTQQKA